MVAMPSGPFCFCNMCTRHKGDRVWGCEGMQHEEDELSYLQLQLTCRALQCENKNCLKHCCGWSVNARTQWSEHWATVGKERMAAVGGQVAKGSAFPSNTAEYLIRATACGVAPKTVKLSQKTIGIKDKCRHNVKDLIGKATTKTKWYSWGLFILSRERPT